MFGRLDSINADNEGKSFLCDNKCNYLNLHSASGGATELLTVIEFR